MRRFLRNDWREPPVLRFLFMQNRYRPANRTEKSARAHDGVVLPVLRFLFMQNRYRPANRTEKSARVHDGNLS